MKFDFFLTLRNKLCRFKKVTSLISRYLSLSTQIKKFLTRRKKNYEFNELSQLEREFFIFTLDIILDIYTHFQNLKEKSNFQMPARIEEDAIRCRGTRKYLNMLGNSQSHFHAKKYAKKKAVL